MRAVESSSDESPKHFVRLYFTAIDDDRSDERRFAVAGGHCSKTKLATEQFVEIGQSKLHDGITIARS
jgi:hypothetical protein